MTAPISPSPSGLRAYRQEIRFLGLFLAILLGSFTLIAWTPVNDAVIEPFTAGVATTSGAAVAR